MAKKSAKYRDLMVLGIVVVVLLDLVYTRMQHKKDPVVQRQPKTGAFVYPYRSAVVAGDTGLVIGYEFHERDEDNGNYKACSAVIHGIDPAKDDYKNLCRSVIRDIVRSVGNNIEVDIYDDYDAYVLGDVKFAQEFMVLTDSEQVLVGKHIVANYCGDKYNNYEGNHTLWFYKDARDKYSEKEVLQQ